MRGIINESIIPLNTFYLTGITETLDIKSHIKLNLFSIDELNNDFILFSINKIVFHYKNGNIIITPSYYSNQFIIEKKENCFDIIAKEMICRPSIQISSIENKDKEQLFLSYLSIFNTDLENKCSYIFSFPFIGKDIINNKYNLNLHIINKINIIENRFENGIVKQNEYFYNFYDKLYVTKIQILSCNEYNQKYIYFNIDLNNNWNELYLYFIVYISFILE